MLYVMQLDDLRPASESTKSDNDDGGDDAGNTKDPQDIDAEVLPLHLYKEVLVEGV